MPTQHGYLILADISGYTFFLAQTELEHANIALSHLLEAIIEKMSAALTIAQLEGESRQQNQRRRDVARRIDDLVGQIDELEGRLVARAE